MIDLDAYLARIGYAGPFEPTVAALEGLCLSHAQSIPFENLDVQLGRPIKLDLASLEDKLVRRRRGGYCFEQNTLFQEVLRRAGFAVEPRAARVRLGAPRVAPRTHMILRVEAEGRPFIADVGFGAEGLLAPVPLELGAEMDRPGGRYRLAAEAGVTVLSSLVPSGWLELYAFGDEAQHPIDFEVASWFTSTHPQSRFVTTLTAQRVSLRERATLRGRELGFRRGQAEERRELASHDELLQVLDEVFGLSFPPETRFPGY